MALPMGYEEKLNSYNISSSLEFTELKAFDPIESKVFTNRWGKWLKKDIVQTYNFMTYDTPGLRDEFA